MGKIVASFVFSAAAAVAMLFSTAPAAEAQAFYGSYGQSQQYHGGGQGYGQAPFVVDPQSCAIGWPRAVPMHVREQFRGQAMQAQESCRRGGYRGGGYYPPQPQPGYYPQQPPYPQPHRNRGGITVTVQVPFG